MSESFIALYNSNTLNRKNSPKTARYEWFEYTRMLPFCSGANKFSKNPIAVPSNPTIVKKQKFIILTAVPETILRFVKCKTGTKSEVKLALAAKMKNIIAIKSVLMLKIKQIHITNKQPNVITDAFFKNITL